MLLVWNRVVGQSTATPLQILGVEEFLSWHPVVACPEAFAAICETNVY
jgi:hypothetical protein